ncbi:hypothetical protein [Actinokineospora inagensis]|uniref:hypothetical protein n=1 Tax=Actinokineospora inagensis TaxID=103730 RepID=UPI00047C562F|nr:hypothetical protein [Actinokineospora inagensis]
MGDDWGAVARCVRERLVELEMPQARLVQRSQVSKLVVREIAGGTVIRSRSPRTLEALSAALELHPQHLLAVLRGESPPKVGGTGDPALDRLDDVRELLGFILARLDRIESRIAPLNAHERQDGRTRW